MSYNYFNFLFYFLFFNSFVQAQITSISGNLIDSNKEPLAFINALVYHSNGNYIGVGALSDQNGFFLIKDIPNGTYTIKFSALGFEEKTVENITISTTNLQVELGAVTILESSYQLESIDLIAEKAILERKIDRAVLNVSSIMSASGGTALDLLEQTPGIVVDRQNLSISMMGKGGVRIMVNGRMNYLPNDAVGAYLAGINADNIETIELITTPPANFDAEGNAGYINIILKNNQELGYNLNGNLSGGYDGGSLGNSGFNFNYVGERVRINSNYAFTLRHNDVPANISRRFFTDTFEESNEFKILREHNRNVHNFIFALESDVSDIIVVGMNVNLFKNYFWLNEYRDVFTNQDLMNYDKQARTESTLWQNYQINTFVNVELSNEFKMQLSFDYLGYENRQPDRYQNTLNYQRSTPEIQTIESLKKSPFKIVYSNLDFNQQLSDQLKLTYGMKVIFSSFDNEQLVKKDEVIDNNFSALTFLDESNYSGYLSVDLSLNEKLLLKGGIRYEHTLTEVITNDQIVVDRDYGNFFPSIFMGYQINDENKTNLSYTRRINRPSFKNMAPFFIYVDERSAFTGNPLLQPSFTDNFQFDYYFKSFFAQLSYSKTNEFIAGFQSNYDEELDLQLNQPLNIDAREMVSFQISLPLNLTSWWSLRPDIVYRNISVNDQQEDEEIAISRNALGVTLTQKFKLNSMTNVEVFSNYNGKTINGNRLVYPKGTLNIALRREVSDVWTFTLNAINIFDTQENIWVTDTSNLYQRINFDTGDPRINLSAVFNLGKSNLKTIKAKTSDASSRL